MTREPGSGTYDTVMHALRADGVVPKRRLEVDTAEAIIQLVAAGLGFAIVSRSAAADALALGRLSIVEVTGLHISRPIMRLSLTASEETAAARAFGRLLGSPTATPGARNGSPRSPAAESPAGRRRRPARR